MKLAMVCGVFLGWRGALHVVLVGALVHGALAMGMLVWARFAPLLGRPAPDLQRLPQAVGLAATSAVVTSIVLIVVTDGLFAVLLNVLGL